MPWFMVFFLVPLVVFLALAAVPRGRAALIAIAATAAVTVVASTLLLRADASGFGAALALLSASAAALAGVAQALRHLVGTGRAPWVYPAMVLGTLVAGVVPALLILRN